MPTAIRPAGENHRFIDMPGTISAIIYSSPDATARPTRCPRCYDQGRPGRKFTLLTSIDAYSTIAAPLET
jgi:hypothetical protein